MPHYVQKAHSNMTWRQLHQPQCLCLWIYWSISSWMVYTFPIIKSISQSILGLIACLDNNYFFSHGRYWHPDINIKIRLIFVSNGTFACFDILGLKVGIKHPWGIIHCWLLSKVIPIQGNMLMNLSTHVSSKGRLFTLCSSHNQTNITIIYWYDLKSKDRISIHFVTWKTLRPRHQHQREIWLIYFHAEFWLTSTIACCYITGLKVRIYDSSDISHCWFPTKPSSCWCWCYVWINLKHKSSTKSTTTWFIICYLKWLHLFQFMVVHKFR